MNHILMFAGTSEGRELVEFVAGLPLSVKCTVCVATDYGKSLLSLGNGNLDLTILSRRFDAAGIESLIRQQQVDLVIDATHPYAVAVSPNIRQACAETAVPCLRLVRQRITADSIGGCEYYPDTTAIVQRLNQLEGNILLTTGSKDLQAFTAVDGYQKRIYPRVIPAISSLQQCSELGFAMSHVISMQGPFSEELNTALIRQFEIAVLVTKESGQAGGFTEKVRAAAKAGIPVLVLDRPVEEEGYTLGEMKQQLLDRLVKQPQENVKKGGGDIGEG